LDLHLSFRRFHPLDHPLNSCDQRLIRFVKLAGFPKLAGDTESALQLGHVTRACQRFSQINKVIGTPRLLRDEAFAER